MSITRGALLIVFVAGCASTPQPPPLVEALQEQMQQTFVPEDQDADTDVIRFHSIHQPWRGDCDDYATTAAFQLIMLGYEAQTEVVWTHDGQQHLVATSGPWVLDNLHSRVVTRREAGYW